jgi:long-chain fatty acid transport protein
VKVFIKVAVILLPLMLIGQAASAQDAGQITETSTGNFYGIGARAMGMGGAHIAAVMDGTALIYNPAALARVRRIELLTSLSHQKFENLSDPNELGTPLSGAVNRSQNNTRLNGINLTVPYPTYRGSMVLAFGLNRVKSFDKTFEIGYSQPEDPEAADVFGVEIETGSIYALSVGAGIDLSQNISIGGSLNYYFGSDNYTWQLSTIEDGSSTKEIVFDDKIKDDYSAVSAKVGFMYTPNRKFRMGITIESPIKYDIDEEYILQTNISGAGIDDIDIGKYNYDLLTPFTFGLGAALNLNRLQLGADMQYSDWTQMEYQDDLALEIENVNINNVYRDVVRLSIGGEYLLPQIGLKLRAGYMYDPLPYSEKSVNIYENPMLSKGFKVIDERQYLTFGLGYLIDGVMTLDVAFVLGGYKLQDNENTVIEDIDLSRIFITTGFRL